MLATHAVAERYVDGIDARLRTRITLRPACDFPCLFVTVMPSCLPPLIAGTWLWRRRSTGQSWRTTGKSEQLAGCALPA